MEVAGSQLWLAGSATRAYRRWWTGVELLRLELESSAAARWAAHARRVWLVAGWALAALADDGVGRAFDAWLKLGLAGLTWLAIPVTLTAASGGAARALVLASGLLEARGVTRTSGENWARAALVAWSLRHIALPGAVSIAVGALLVSDAPGVGLLLRWIAGVAAYGALLGVGLAVSAVFAHRLGGRRGAWVLALFIGALQLALLALANTTVPAAVSALLNLCLGLRA